MKKIFTSVLLVALSVLASSAAPESTKAERNYIKEGNERFKAGNYHEALALYEKAITANTSSEAASFNKAVTLLHLASDDNKGTENDPRVAAAKLFQDIASTSQDAELAAKSFYNLGNMLYNDEKYKESIEMYKGSLRKRPNDHKTRQNLRLAQLKLEEQENQDQNQDNQEQEQQQQQQEQQQQQQQEQQQQQQQQEQPQMTNNAEQILQTMQNKENATRKKVNEQEARPAGKPTTDKPW